MGQWPFLGSIAEKHADDSAHVRFNIDYKNFLVVAHKQRTPTIGWEDSADLDRHDVVLHDHSVIGGSRKNKWGPEGFNGLGSWSAETNRRPKSGGKTAQCRLRFFASVVFRR